MAAAAVATDFVDEYIGAIETPNVNFMDTDNLPDKIFFPGQVISNRTEYFRIIDINNGRATLMKLTGTLTNNLKKHLSGPIQMDNPLLLSPFTEFDPLSNPTSLKPSTNTNKQDLDLMPAYAPDRSAEIMENYVIEYEGTRMKILGIFRSYENQLYYLIRFDDNKHKFWRMREGGRLVRRADTASDDTASANTARRRPFDSARMRSMRRLADGESLDRRFENIESRLERIERRLGSENPEDDEPIVPDADDADSLPSLSIRF
jgi:hypothetical protein